MQKITHPRNVLTPEALAMLSLIASTGSFAAAARELGMVPSALTYRVRAMEEALDALLFDRSSRQARPTEAGAALLKEGQRVLQELDSITQRIKRVATGWEPHFNIAFDTLINKKVVLELCAQFYQLAPPTQLRLREETLSGTLESVISGQSDLGLGVSLESATVAGLQLRPLGKQSFVFAVAPQHPLAHAAEPLSDDLLKQHRAIAVADSIKQGQGLTVGLLGGQDVLTVPTMAMKLQAQILGLGVGFLPEQMAAPHLKTGQLVTKKVARTERLAHMSYAWRTGNKQQDGKAMQWWKAQLEKPATRQALLGC